MFTLCVIPARIASVRLPRKPLSLIGGKPMVQRTFEAAKACECLNQVVVATDSKEIADLIHQIGGDVEMTGTDCLTGSDRVAIVAKQYPQADVIINLQGDEPFVKPEMLNTLIEPYLIGENPDMTTLASPLDGSYAYRSPDIVKVITNLQSYAIYFSRAAIPYLRTIPSDMPVLHHKGVYAFRRDFLETYTQLEQTPLELAESLEQLRVIEHGYKIRVCWVKEHTLEINTPKELAEAEAFLKKVKHRSG